MLQFDSERMGTEQIVYVYCEETSEREYEKAGWLKGLLLHRHATQMYDATLFHS